VIKIFTFKGLQKEEAQSVSAGDIALVAGLPDIFIGETVADSAEAESLPAIGN